MLFQPTDVEKRLIQQATRGDVNAIHDLEAFHHVYYHEQIGWTRDNSLQDLKDEVMAIPQTVAIAAFRVWDQRQHMFVAASSCALGGDGALWIGGVIQHDISAYSIERCTGQIARDGSDIYIGDIIQCRYRWWGQEMTEIHLVELDAYQRILPFHGLFAYEHELWIALLHPRIALLGNIHEHPACIPDGGGHWHGRQSIL